MSRDRRRPTRRQGAASSAPAEAPASARPSASRPASAPKVKPQWRETIDSFGGFMTIGAVVLAVVVVGAIFVMNRGGSTPQTSTELSTDTLMGSAIPVTDTKTDRQHIADASLLQIPKGEPPTRGPHFAVPQNTGVYQQPVPDGNAIHALEHGIVWLSYNPSKVDADTIKKLEALGKQFSIDTIVSPRPDNDRAIDIVSWGQIMTMDKFDKGELEKFITTNRNRSPEPFVRTTTSM